MVTTTNNGGEEIFMARTKMTVSTNNELRDFYGTTSNGRYAVSLGINYILVEYSSSNGYRQPLSFMLGEKPRLRGDVPVIDWCQILDKFEEEGVMIGNTPIKDYLSKRRAYWR